MFKVGDKKSTSFASVNIIWVLLSLAWNIILKSVMDLSVVKVKAFTKNSSKGACDRLDVVCFRLWAVWESVLGSLLLGKL